MEQEHVKSKADKLSSKSYLNFVIKASCHHANSQLIHSNFHKTPSRKLDNSSSQHTLSSACLPASRFPLKSN